MSQSTSAAPVAHRPAGARFVRLLATVGGLGYLPLAPGTWGSLAGLPLAVWQASLSPGGALAFALSFTVVSIGVSHAAERAFGTHDASHVVIDEVAGILWTFLWVPLSPLWLAVGFGLFRFFDALKPGPIGWLDRRVSGGLGVVLDDVAAGVVSCLVLRGLQAAFGVACGSW